MCLYVPLAECTLSGFSRFLIGYLYTLFNILINQLKKNKKRSPSSLLSLLLFLVCLDIPKHWENEISVEKIQWKLMFFFIRWEFVPKHLLNSCEECTHTQTLTNILLKNFPQRECSTTINHFLQLPKLFFTLFQNRLHSISAQIQRQHHYPKNMKSMFL